MKSLAVNRRAKFDYEILKEYEAGIVLKGHEVKSVKAGGASLKGSFVASHKGELFLTNALIPLYKLAGKTDNFDPTASRKLLLHKKELAYLMGKIQTEGLTLVPLSMYNKNDRIKLSFGLAKGKKKHDKRQTIKRREDKIKMERAMKQ